MPQDQTAEWTWLDPISLVLALLALAVSVYVVVDGWRLKRRDLSVDLWKTWISPDFRRYRVTAYRAIRLAKKGLPNPPSLQAMMKDVDFEVALGSIEHFLVEIAALRSNRICDVTLFDKLMRTEIEGWKRELRGLDRTDSNAFEQDVLDDAFKALLK